MAMHTAKTTTMAMPNTTGTATSAPFSEPSLATAGCVAAALLPDGTGGETPAEGATPAALVGAVDPVPDLEAAFGAALALALA